MIDFACHQFNLDEIVKCSLGLTKADYKVLMFLMDHRDEEFVTDDVAKELSLNLSTVQRAVKKLHEKDVLVRNQKNLSNGGYVFVYSVDSKGRIRKIISEIVMNWAKNVTTKLNSW